MNFKKVMDLVKVLKDANEKIYFNDILFQLEKYDKAYEFLTTTYCKFKPGDRVYLRENPVIPESSGWYPCRHFLIKGARGTVNHVEFMNRESDGTNELWYNIVFDDESWKDSRTGEIHKRPEDAKHTYHFTEKELAKENFIRAWQSINQSTPEENEIAPEKPIQTDLLDSCKWGEGDFRIYDPDPKDPHSKLFIVFPFGSLVDISGSAEEGVDQARAEWIVRALNNARGIRKHENHWKENISENPPKQVIERFLKQPEASSEQPKKEDDLVEIIKRLKYSYRLQGEPDRIVSDEEIFRLEVLKLIEILAAKVESINEK